jgi:hypothetical protein
MAVVDNDGVAVRIGDREHAVDGQLILPNLGDADTHFSPAVPGGVEVLHHEVEAGRPTRRPAILPDNQVGPASKLQDRKGLHHGHGAEPQLLVELPRLDRITPVEHQVPGPDRRPRVISLSHANLLVP